MTNEILTILSTLATIGVGGGILKLAEMYFSNKSKNNDFAHLQLEVSELKKLIVELKTKEHSMQAEINILHTEINNLREENATFRGLLASQEDRNESIKALLKNKIK